MKTVLALLLSCLPLAWAGTYPDRYHVVWDSPSTNHQGSMPLGNGDIGLNVWAEAGGDLQFFISKTDAWDDYGRLLKVGKVRLRLEPNPFALNASFQQTLNLRNATIDIQAGQGGQFTKLQIWVDANHPTIHVTVESATPCTASIMSELWRTNDYAAEMTLSDVLTQYKLPDGRPAQTIVQPDTILSNLPQRIGWFHHNRKSVGPALLADVQGLTGFPQIDPLLHRTFGTVITTPRPERIDDQHLRSTRGNLHQFSIHVFTRHPASPEQWLASMETLIQKTEAQPLTARRTAHEQWWAAFWDRSWIQATLRPGATPANKPVLPTNTHPLRIGQDQQGHNRWAGELGRVSIYAEALSEAEIRVFTNTPPSASAPKGNSLAYSGNQPGPVPNSASWGFDRGLTVEAWVNPATLPAGGARIADKVTVGGSDGFLLDTYPGNSLRFICGETMLQKDQVLAPGRWSHVAAVADPAGSGCRLYLNGQLLADTTQAIIRDEAAHLSHMYHLQRFITACAGRGAYPIKFNGSIFTVPPSDRKGDADFRLWGPGYWWQNTRLPYFSMCANGDYDLMRPLFRMYADELLEFCKYRTRQYTGHGGAFYPECIYFWGSIFSETYGWTHFTNRTDKLQESGWHKWEWVGGLELCAFMLDYYEYTLDEQFLRRTALPFTHEILAFFDEHYSTNAQGKLVMHPSQALETWWECTNPMPELAGCYAVIERLLNLPHSLTSTSDREAWQRLHAKLPPLPVRTIKGKIALAAAEKFAKKQNIENPELYAVFPFRLIGVGRPHLDWGITALQHRDDKGNFGWRQDDIFMAYLGLTNEVRQYLTGRAQTHDRHSRFPAFWGPNYDWVPDQDHGGVLMKTFQAMLLQTDGRKLYLFPAWPADWDVEFKLRAPYQTTIEGTYRAGKLESLRVTPESRRGDVILGMPANP